MLAESVMIEEQPLSIQQAIDLGVQHHQSGDLPKAESIYQQVLKADPDQPVALHLLGVIAHQAGKNEIAVDLITKAITIKPDYFEAHNNLGITLVGYRRLDEAIISYSKALAIKPDYAEAHYNLGGAFQELWKLDEAVASYNKAIAIKPDYAEAHSNLGLVHHWRGKIDDALVNYDKAIAIKPDYAEAHTNQGFSLLAKGYLKQGLDEYEWRWKINGNRSKQRRFSQHQWDGQADLSDLKILVWGEQGPGDMTIWASLLSQISALTGRCTLECAPKLVPLFTRSFPAIDVCPENLEADFDRKDFDYHLPMGSLFRHFTSNLLEVAEPEAFLKPDPKQVAYWRNRLNELGSGPFVGISWKSPLMNSLRSPNYTSLWEWRKIFKNCNATFINLQSTDYAGDLDRVESDLGQIVHDFKDLDQFNDLDEVAALTKALDITISVATAVAAISAGVGTPTWVISWQQSIWNNTLLAPRGPSVQFFRRDTCDTWDKTFKTIEENLARETKKYNFEFR